MISLNTQSEPGAYVFVCLFFYLAKFHLVKGSSLSADLADACASCMCIGHVQLCAGLLCNTFLAELCSLHHLSFLVG